MAGPGENLRLNGDRLWDSIHEMAKIGPGVAGGNNRQAVTDADGEGRTLFQKWCEEAGLTMSVDEMGSMFMYRPGSDPDARVRDVRSGPDGRLYFTVEGDNGRLLRADISGVSP